MVITATTPRPILPMIAIAAILVMGACGGGGDDSGATASQSTSGSAPNTSSVTDDSAASGSPAAWADDKCSIVSADDVGAAVGEPVSSRDYPVFGCQYTATDPVSRTAVVIDYFPSSFECELVESRNPDAEVVEGLGVHAVNGMSSIGGVLAVTLDEDRCFFVEGGSRAVAEAVLASLGSSSGGTSSENAVEAPSAATAPDTSSSSTADSSAEVTGTEAVTTAPGNTDTASPDTIGDPCRWLTPDEAAAALGVEVRPPVKIEIPDSAYGPGADCAYNSVDEPAGPASVHVAVLGDQFPRDLWEQAQAAEGFSAVAGVGELAYFDGNSKLEVFDQGRWIQVQVINPLVMAGDDLIPLLSDLARNAIERA